MGVAGISMVEVEIYRCMEEGEISLEEEVMSNDMVEEVTKMEEVETSTVEVVICSGGGDFLGGGGDE
uniref:Uncharacterized protein n=1 Tax=Salix viminalis TaxID=40686 RepID=A0A6N2MIF3_SALVM